ncbi:MAG: hypothetical protein ABIR39_12730, partial [Nocardioides sp.]|uniref:hypothetical protein n=1 Tax=Nocardioides sp. TaxID=35761 RepID=UPI003266F41B
RTSARPGRVAGAYWRLVITPAYVLPAASLSIGIGYLFCYLGGASYVYQGHYGLNQAEFGLIFGVTGSAALLGAVAAHLLSARLRTTTLAKVGCCVLVAGAGVSLAAAAVTVGVFVMAGGMFLGLFGLGLMEPALMSMCLAAAREGFGAASALVGAAQNFLGGLATVVVASYIGENPVGWTVPMVMFALLATALALRASHNESSI